MTDLLPREEDVPSHRRDVLARIEGELVTALVRYSSLPPKDASEELGIPPSLVFSLTSGPLLVSVAPGWIVGFASQPSLASVTLWMEEGPAGVVGRHAVRTDTELHAVDARDPLYSNDAIGGLVGKRVTSISVLKRLPDSALFTDLPCEAGVLMRFEDGSELIASHGLHNDSDDFSVITRSEISAAVVKRLEELSLADIPRTPDLD